MSTPPTVDDDSLAAITTRLFLARRAELVERLQREPDREAEALPPSTQVLAYLFDAAGMRDYASLSTRTFQRQKSGKRTANTRDRTLGALTRLLIDALEGESVPDIEIAKLAGPLRSELEALSSTWDRMAVAIDDAADPVATRHAILRVAMVELAVRRAALLRALGAKTFEPWFATAPHPIDRAIQVALVRHDVTLDALRRRLHDHGIPRRTFESWRHERQVPPADEIDLVATAVVDLGKRARGERARKQSVAMLRCARAAKMIRRGLIASLGEEGEAVFEDACRGHERLCEVVFEVIGDEAALKDAVTRSVVMHPSREWADNLRASSGFDQVARQLSAPDQGWLVKLVSEDDPAAPFFRLIAGLPLERRLDAVRLVLVQGLLQPETSATLYAPLRLTALHEMAWAGPRALTFRLLYPRIATSVASQSVRDDLRGLSTQPLHRVLDHVARADVLACCRAIVREHGGNADHIDGLERQMLLFGSEPAS